MKSKQSILLAIFFALIVAGMWFVASARSNQAQARAQEEKARAAAQHAMQEHHKLKNQNPAAPAK